MTDPQATPGFDAPTAAAPTAPPQATPEEWGRIPAPANPHKTLSIVGFILSFFFLLNVAGLVVSIVAMVKSRRAGFHSRFALAGIIIGGLGVFLTLGITAMVIPAFIDGISTCAELGNGTHVIGDRAYSCAPGSFQVSSAW